MINLQKSYPEYFEGNTVKALSFKVSPKKQANIAFDLWKFINMEILMTIHLLT